MKDRGLSLRSIFDLIDTDASKGISLEELEEKNELLDIGLTNSEIQMLFESIDVNKDLTITYQELVGQFKGANSRRLLKQIRTIIEAGNIEKIHSRMCFDKFFD